VPLEVGTTIGIETGLLHTYYGPVLSRSDLGIFEGTLSLCRDSRSEFADLLGVLEGVELISLSYFLALTSGSSAGRGKKAFGRSTSFGAGLGKNGAVKLVEGVWADEIRGLGVSRTDLSSTSNEFPIDARKEEIRGIWEREKSRLTKDLKAHASASAASRPEIGFPRLNVSSICFTTCLLLLQLCFLHPY
jgi:cell division control protein 6